MKKEKIVQGETYEYSITLNPCLYPSPPWDGKMVLTSEKNVYELEGTGEGCTQSFKASPQETMAFEAGHYKYRVVVTDGTDVYTAWRGNAEVKLDPNVPGNDMSHVEKVLRALEATIEGKATSDILNYSIRGRSIGRMSPDELLSWRDKYRRFWKEEQHEEDISNGLDTQRGIIRVRL